MARTRKMVAADVVHAGAPPLDRLTRACPYLFLVLCLVTALFQAWNLPPFQGADELAHSYRVDLGTFAKFSAERVQKRKLVAGGPTDMALYEAHLPFDNIRFHLQEKADAVDFQKAGAYRWDGRTTRVGYPGSAIYPPFFYMPQSAGLAIGKLFDLPVITSFHLARSGNALACTFVGFFALLLAGRSRLLMFALLLLPMSTALYSILGNDGLMITVTALGAAAVSRAMHEGRAMTRGEVVAAAVCFALVAATKPPYAPLALVFLVCDMEKRWWRYAAAVGVVAFAVACTLWVALWVQTALTAPGSSVDPARQLAWLLHHPAHGFVVARETLTRNFEPYANMFIGVLGWLDAAMPPPYYRAAWIMLGVALVLSLSRGLQAAWRWVPAASLIAALAAFGAVHGALYLSWSPVGSSYVDGVQGRYFLPLAVMICLAVEGARPRLPQGPVMGRLSQFAAGVVMAFPILTALLVQHVIIVRYYLD